MAKKKVSKILKGGVHSGLSGESLKQKSFQTEEEKEM
jgi:hypothetical protein